MLTRNGMVTTQAKIGEKFDDLPSVIKLFRITKIIKNLIGIRTNSRNMNFFYNKKGTVVISK